MNKLFVILLIFNAYCVFGQNVVEVNRIELSKEFQETAQKASQYRDSSIYRKIENLENGLITSKSMYERYRIIVNTLSGYYTATKQYDKAIDLWIEGNNEGIIFPFDLEDSDYPYLQEYVTNKRFADFLLKNDSLRNNANTNSKAEYFVNLPTQYNPNHTYPLLIILHGGTGNNNAVFNDWKSETIHNSFISVYPRGRFYVGSYLNSFGQTGIDDIQEIYQQVIKKYSVDTSNVILAGQSLGGHLAIRLSYNSINTNGLLLAFPVKPQDFDYKRACEFKNHNLRIVLICGERDEYFFPGQLEMSSILDSANVENRFIKYQNLGHGFPTDFSEQIDKGLQYILNDK